MASFSKMDDDAPELKAARDDLSDYAALDHKPAPISVSLSLAAAIRAHKAGKMEKAVSIYSGILKKYPEHADANYLLGVAAFERGLKEDAIAMIERAIASEPDNPAYFGKLGEILTQMGQVVLADEAYEKAARLAPDNVSFHLGRAIILERNGDTGSALKQYRHIIEKWPECAEAFYRAAVLEARFGERDLARQHVRDSLKLKPGYAEAHFLYALLILAVGKQDKATAHFQQASLQSADRPDLHIKVANKLIQLSDYKGALQVLRREIKLNPKSASAYCLMGDCLRARLEYDGAALSYREAIEANPRKVEAYVGLALCLIEMDDVSGAMKTCQQAQSFATDHSQVLSTMGIVLRKDDKILESIETLKKAVQKAPDTAQPLAELAISYQDNLELDQALEAIEKAQKIEPRNKALDLRRGEILLQQNNWREGFKAYESRKSLPDWVSLISRNEDVAPEWAGESLADKRVLVYCEQSYSDALLFVRFLPKLAERCKVVYLYCQKDLARLFSHVEGVGGVVPLNTPIPRHDVKLALNSLPFVLDIKTPLDLGTFSPYLSASDKEIKEWSARLEADSSAKRVGLCWQGDRGYSKDGRRSPGIWPFSRLFYMRNLDFFGLQVGDGSDVLGDPQLAKVVRNYGIDLLDFADTAALVSALDLVVTCDTAVAHLAGALGKEVWTVLPYGVDWRWGIPEDLKPAQCLWYPSMKLFRQSAPGDWADVFARLGQELDRLA